MYLYAEDIPADVQVKIEAVMRKFQKTWSDAVLFLLSEGDTTPKRHPVNKSEKTTH